MQLKVVHYVVSYVYLRDQVIDTIKEKEAEDGRPGWYCFGEPGIMRGNDGSFGSLPGWVPGTLPEHFPEGTGMYFNEDMIMVIQMHYNTSGGTGPDQTEVHFELAEPGADLKAITGIELFAPVEIPCPAEIDTEACTREAAKKWPTSESDLAEELLAVCDKTVADYAGQSAENVVSDCTLPIGIDGDVISANAHMHELGKTFRIELNPDTPDAQIVLDVDRWNFDWQGNYTFVEPIRVKKGDKVRVTCSWDNSPVISGQASLTPYQDSRTKVAAERSDQLIQQLTGAHTAFAHNEVDEANYRYIIWGEGTSDEMCLGAMIIVPDDGFEDVPPMSDDFPLKTIVRLTYLSVFGGNPWALLALVVVFALPIGWFVRRRIRRQAAD